MQVDGCQALAGTLYNMKTAAAAALQSCLNLARLYTYTSTLA